MVKGWVLENKIWGVCVCVGGGDGGGITNEVR